MFRPLIAVLIAATLAVDPGGASESPRDEDAAVRAVLDSYLTMVAYPDPRPIDAEIFADNIEAFWSTGGTYLGRDAVADALGVGIAEIASEHESLRRRGRRCEDPTQGRPGLADLPHRVSWGADTGSRGR